MVTPINPVQSVAFIMFHLFKSVFKTFCPEILVLMKYFQSFNFVTLNIYKVQSIELDKLPT